MKTKLANGRRRAAEWSAWLLPSVLLPVGVVAVAASFRASGRTRVSLIIAGFWLLGSVAAVVNPARRLRRAAGAKPADADGPVWSPMFADEVEAGSLIGLEHDDEVIACKVVSIRRGHRRVTLVGLMGSGEANDVPVITFLLLEVATGRPNAMTVGPDAPVRVAMDVEQLTAPSGGA